MRVVVVGAGPTGLFSAMVLAGQEHQVVVVDRDPGAGAGRVVVASRRDAIPPPARLPRAGSGGAAGRAATRLAQPARRGGRARHGSGRCAGSAADGDPVPPTDLRTRAAHHRGARPAGGAAAHRARRAGVHRPRPRQRRARRRRNPGGGPGHCRLRADRSTRPRPAGARPRRRLRRSRAPSPASTGSAQRRTRPDERPVGPDRLLPRVPGHRVPARQRVLLHPHRPLQRRPRAGRAAPHRPVRGRRPRHPRARRLDRSGPGAAPHPGPDRRSPAQHLPGPTRRHRRRSPCPGWSSSGTPCAPPTRRLVAASPPPPCCRPASSCACSSTTRGTPRASPPPSTTGAPPTSPVVPRPRPQRRGADRPLDGRRHRPHPAPAVRPDRRHAARGRPLAHAARRPYLGMRALPTSLDPLQPRVRQIYADGWRPPAPDGPLSATTWPT